MNPTLYNTREVRSQENYNETLKEINSAWEVWKKWAESLKRGIKVSKDHTFIIKIKCSSPELFKKFEILSQKDYENSLKEMETIWDLWKKWESISRQPMKGKRELDKTKNEQENAARE